MAGAVTRRTGSRVAVLTEAGEMTFLLQDGPGAWGEAFARGFWTHDRVFGSTISPPEQEP